MLGSFNGPEPGGLELTISKWKRELEGGGEKERERKKDTGTQALMEQMCFNDLSVSIYRLLYKKFLSTMIKIRKPNVQQLLPREQGINNGHKIRRQSVTQERGSKQFCCKANVLLKETQDCLHNDHNPESCLQFYSLLAEADKEQRTYEK